MMRLAITNLVFPDQINPDFLNKLYENGIAGVEVAPTKICNWEELSTNILKDYKSKLNYSGLEISSLQSLFFGLDNCQILGSEQQFDNMINQFYKITEIANVLDVDICLFGSPKSRLKLNVGDEYIREMLFNRMGGIAKIFEKAGKILVVESIPVEYGGQILVDYKSVLSLVKSINSTHLKMHLDIGCVSTAGDDISQAIIDCNNDLFHYQASEKNVGPFNKPKFLHKAASASLVKIGYKGWVSIEMIGVSGIDEILDSITYTRNIYCKKKKLSIKKNPPLIIGD